MNRLSLGAVQIQAGRGSEVLTDPTYLRVCRGVLAFRLLACCLTLVLTAPETALSAVLLVAVSALSAWGMLSDGFVRRLFRHPIFAVLDVALVVALMVLEWPISGALLIVAMTALLLGLTLTPWLGLPGLVLTLGSITLLALDSSTTSSGEQALAMLIALPLSVLGMTTLGWTIRFAFVELKRSRDQFTDEVVHRRHQEERQRLARDMHDSLGKTVHGIGLAAAAMRTAASKGQVSLVEELSSDIQDAARVAADESRSLLLGLRRGQSDRPVIDQLGDLARSRASADLALRVEGHGVADLPGPICAEVVAITQEAVDNIVKHASASTASIELIRDEGALTLRIHDDGRGFDLDRTVPSRERKGHYGLRGMAERASSSRGEVRIESVPGQGTTVLGQWDLDAWEDRS